MEFLSLPRDPISHGESSVLPVFDEHGYDGGPFLEYLHRHPRSLFSDSEASIEIFEIDVERHYQNWLFFGLLHEFLGDLFDPDDYISYDEDLGFNCIVTSDLRSILRGWRKTRLPAIQETDPEFSHFKACLEEVWGILELTETFFAHHGPRLALQMDVIAALAELVTNVIKKHNHDFHPMSDTEHGCNWLAVSYQGRLPTLHKTADTMIHVGGWCKADIQMCLHDMETFEKWHYLRHLRIRQDCALHSACSQLACEVVKARNSSILPRHVTAECRCASFDAGSAGLTKIYERGCLPCLEIVPAEAEGSDPTETANTTQVRVISVSFKMKKETRYVAMSHVWSDGTGNGHANSLPLCQLRAIHQRVGDFHRTQDPRFDGQPVLLWIDTVCCPYEQGPAKQLALAKMKDIYQNASSVHVWDRSLLSWEARGDSLEWIIRILLSKWMRRLWTAQEAIFATQSQECSLIIHCADAAEPLTRLYRHAYRRKQFGSALAYDFAKQIMRIENVFWPGVGGSSARQLLMTAWLVQYRHTSVAADEALVLANVLGLDGANFSGLSPEEGMRKLWSLIFTILPSIELHSCIPFCPTPKLTAPGFRWAPRSLMYRNGFGPSEFFFE